MQQSYQTIEGNQIKVQVNKVFPAITYDTPGTIADAL
jgi:hypothetical protein